MKHLNDPLGVCLVALVAGAVCRAQTPAALPAPPPAAPGPEPRVTIPFTGTALADSAVSSILPNLEAATTLQASTGADLAVLDITVSSGVITPGGLVRLTALVGNIGTTAETNVPVDCRLWNRIAIEPTTFISLQPGATAELHYTWKVPDYQAGSQDVLPVYLFVVSIGPVAGESTTSDNMRSVSVGPDRLGNLVIQHAMEEGKEVHQWIGYQGYRYFADQVSGADISFYVGTWNDAQGDDRNTFLEGTAAEDKGDRPPLWQSCPNPIDCRCPYYNHFCAGADGSEIYAGYWGIPCFTEFDSALEQAGNIWPYAVSAYASNRGLAFYYLGHVAHLLGDMTVPCHTHNDEHPFWDSYEDTIEVDHNFQLWSFNAGRSGDWTQDLTLFADLYSLFYRTANYTEDYDSNDADGDGPPYYFPSDYVSTWHRPQDVSNAGADIDLNEVMIIGDDLMPYAMKRTAELLRLFYSQVDTSAPSCSLTYPASEDVNNPDYRRSTTSFSLTASASDLESGVVNKSYHFQYTYWTGSDWASWADIPPSPTTSSVSFTPVHPNTVYAFHCSVWNGGGRAGASTDKYLMIDTSMPSVPAITGYSDSGHGAILVSGDEYSYTTPHFDFSASDSPSGVAGYHYYWGTSPSGTPTVWTTGMDYTAPPLAADGDWYFRVLAEDKAGNTGDAQTFVYRFRQDSDGDGVQDTLDRCPGTIPGATVDPDGCPPIIPGDFDRDGDVDVDDFEAFEGCATGPGIAGPPIGCTPEQFEQADTEGDTDVDAADFAAFQRCYSGQGNPADPACAG